MAHEAETYTTRRIRTVFGTVEVHNPRAAFAPLMGIFPDLATLELLKWTRLWRYHVYLGRAEILKRLPRTMPKSITLIINWHVSPWRIRPVQQVADHMTRSDLISREILSSIDNDVRAVKWHL